VRSAASGSAGALIATGPSGVSGLDRPRRRRQLGPLLPPPPIVRDMIPFGAKRKSQMRAYALLHYESTATTSSART